MNTKEYIESGILDAYLLGALDAAEEAEVQANIARYPELAGELRRLEDAMLRMAEGMAMPPPLGLEDKIWDSLQPPVVTTATGESKAGPKTIAFEPGYRQKPLVWRNAAVWAALAGSVALNLVLYNQTKKAGDERTAMNDNISKLQAEQQQLAAQVAQFNKAKEMMADTAMQTIVMHTVVKDHPMAATVYWSKAKGETYVAMNALPVPPQGKQYQLWVIRNGKPESMGVLPNDMANTPGIQKIPMNVTDGQAFAISLEKEGGNPTPTEVYVLGKPS